ncbi:MAG: 30S ribosomal protein S17 [Panacagrimonas sp.]
MSEEHPPVAAEKAQRRIVGRVISDKANKTITVLVERSVKHPLYGKIMRRSTKLHAHDEENRGKIGDVVALVETRPISRSKHFKLAEVLDQKHT